jgi:hypothetical protein
MKKIECVKLIVITSLVVLMSCSKDMTSDAFREGKYKCNGEYYSYCRSCIPQDTNYVFSNTLIITYKGDSLSINNGIPMSRINNDSFVYDRGPGYPGIFYSVKFIGSDSFYYHYYQYVQAFNITKSSYCKKIE